MSETYTANVNFVDEEITDEEYEEAISELELVDGAEVEERKQNVAMVANSESGASLALMAGTLAVTGIDTLVNIYKLARSNPAFYHLWITDEDGNKIEPWDDEQLEFYGVKGDDERVLAKVDGDENDVEINIDGPVYLVNSSEVSMFDDAEED